MFGDHQNEIRYKWDAGSGTGYRLRFDSNGRRYRVEDWNNHIVVDAVGCTDLDEALGVLNRFFTIDVASERHRVAARLQ